MKTRTKLTCPLEVTHDAIKGKWKPIILWSLKDGPTSLSILEKSINGISQKMLIEQLKEMISCGLIEKNEFEGYPLKVEYLLTEMGKELLEAVVIMQKIGIKLMNLE